MDEEPKPVVELGPMSEDEANELLDRLFLKQFGRTYREPVPTADPAPPVDSLDRILRDYPLLFDGGLKGTA